MVKVFDDNGIIAYEHSRVAQKGEKVFKSYTY